MFSCMNKRNKHKRAVLSIKLTIKVINEQTVCDI